MDVHTREQRSRNMAAIRSRNTGPERAVRSLVHILGFRYRLHVRDLPGKPDLVFRSARKVIFVHGCFWHRHECPLGQVKCGTNTAFWERKFRSNMLRDRKNVDELRELGWKVLIVWECWLTDRNRLRRRITAFLRSGQPASANGHRRRT